MQLDKEDTHVLDEATGIVNVFLISWFFCLFLLSSISLRVKYNLILRYEAWVNAIRTSSFVENFLKSAQSHSLSSQICSESSHKIGCSLPIVFQPQKFSRNRPFFPQICPWKSREILLFFPRPTRSPDWVFSDWIEFGNCCFGTSFYVAAIRLEQN